MIVRFLDPQLQQQLGIPFDDLKLPLETLKELHPGAAQLFVVENEIPLRSLPSLRRTIAVGGLGDAVTLLTDLGWAESLQITYWGDLDVEGF